MFYLVVIPNDPNRFLRCKYLNLFHTLLEAFDSVRYCELFNILRAVGIERKDLSLIQNIFWNQEAITIVDGEYQIILA